MKSHNRRHFLKNLVAGSSALLASPFVLNQCNSHKPGNKLFLLRYDTEWWGEWSEMDGFIDKVIEIHTSNKIPATFFCKGETLFKFNKQFMEFHQEVKDDPLFDFQDHSYSHIGLGYERGKPVPELNADYIKSFEIHEEVFGKKPAGISICGTGDDGPRLPGFDATTKSKEEFEMVADLGIKMINTCHTQFDESREFMNFSDLGHKEIMGFPSAYSDTSWMHRKESGDPTEFIMEQIKERSVRNDHMPLMLHDWVAWQHAKDKELSHVVKLTDYAREMGYELVTHIECYDRKKMWQS